MSNPNLENIIIGDEERRRRLAAAYRIILSAARRKHTQEKKPELDQKVPLSPSVGVESYDLQVAQN